MDERRTSPTGDKERDPSKTKRANPICVYATKTSNRFRVRARNLVVTSEAAICEFRRR